MGPNAMISIRDTYSEPTNIFTVCMGPPGCGKSQAFRLAILDPLNDISKKVAILYLYLTKINLIPKTRRKAAVR